MPAPKGVGPFRRSPPQAKAQRQQSERPVFGRSRPKTFACLTHPAASPCGGRWFTRTKNVPAGRMHYLFTMSNTRNRSHTGTIANCPISRHPSQPLTRETGTTRSPAQRSGGARRDRTDDLKLAKLPLSQLSYGPIRGQRSVVSNQNCASHF